VNFVAQNGGKWRQNAPDRGRKVTKIVEITVIFTVKNL
jgi:hypothetical protein